MGELSDDLGIERPANIWWLAVQPPPALGWDDDTGPPSTPLAQRDFPSAAREGFRFLEALGFRFLASDAWDVSEESVVVGWEREDAVIAAGLDTIGTFSLLVLPRLGELDNTPLRNRIELLAGGKEPFPTYGAFAVVGETREQIADELRGHVQLLRERITPLLTPGAGLEPLRTALADLVEGIAREQWIERCQREAEAAWRDPRYEALLDLARQLEQLGTPLGDSERLTVARRRAKPPLNLGQKVLDESTRNRRAAQLVEETQQRLAAAYAEKGNDRQAAARWKDAAREATQALALLYSEEFCQQIDALRQGANHAVEPALTFLEVDPWCFRSGYAKETILRYLKRAELNAEQRERARRVILHVVDVGDRREFRGYCRLARRVVDDGLREELLARLRSEDFGRARRALWVLYALGDRLSTEDRLAGRGRHRARCNRPTVVAQLGLGSASRLSLRPRSLVRHAHSSGHRAGKCC